MKIRRVLACVFLGLLLSGCYEPRTSEVIVIAGDSIPAQASYDIHFKVRKADHAPIIINESTGAASAFSTDYICGRAESIYRLLRIKRGKIFVHLGTNDMISGRPPVLFGRDVDAIMGCIDPETDVYWIPPHHSTLYDRVLASAAQKWPNLDILEFNPKPGQIDPDGIHLTNWGNQAFAQMIKAAVYN